MATIDIKGATLSGADPPISTNPNADLAIKAPVRVATTGTNINLQTIGLGTIDGVTLAAGDRVLVKDETDQTTNGLYNASTGPWTRTIDANNNSQWARGVQVFVTDGTANGGTGWKCIATNPITLGTTALIFAGINFVPGSNNNLTNVLNFGADPKGVTANFGAAFNAAMTACAAAGPLGIALNGTVYIPAGFYKLGSTVMNWKQGCNILADHAAYIQANVSVANMLTSGTGLSNTLEEVFLEGGQWDGNGKVTDSGFAIPDFANITLHHFRMYGCNGAAGNGSIGGFIRLAGAGTVQSNGIHVHHASLYNFTSPIATLVAGNYGIFTDPSSIAGPTDSRFENIVVAGCSIGFQGVYFDGVFTDNHAFVFSTQGNMVNGFKLTSGQCRLIGNQVDGPLVTSNAAYDLSGGPYVMLGNEYFEETNNNVSNAVNMSSSVTLFSYGNLWIGNSGSNLINTDYTGTLIGLSALGDFTQNVSTINAFGVQAGTSATYTVKVPKGLIILNFAGTVTAILPNPASAPDGASFTLKTITNNTVVSASSNVVPLAGGAAGTAILAATAGKWATLVTDGTNWNIAAAN